MSGKSIWLLSLVTLVLTAFLTGCFIDPTKDVVVIYSATSSNSSSSSSILSDTNWANTNLGINYDPASSNGAWSLVWSDEFNIPDFSGLDATTWTYDIGNGSGGWGNNELEYYRQENSYIYKGTAVLKATNQSYGGKSYTSARIKTQGLRSFSHAVGGKIAARIQLPFGRGLWPAFWMMGENTNNWPANGEIDIMENRGSYSNISSGALHGTGYSGGGCFSASNVNVTGYLSTSYHIYEMIWTSNSIKWYVDGSNFQTVTKTQVTNKGPWLFDTPFYIMFNVAIASATTPFWNQAPDGTTIWAQYMFIDWVRVYTN